MSSPSMEPELPKCPKARLSIARTRLRRAAEQGRRMVVYELALELDMSEFHFARRFREAFGHSPYAFYDEIRAALARDLLRDGHREGAVARRIGLRRPGELRRLLRKRSAMQSLSEAHASEGDR